MELLKKHYEKILLGVVLVGLAVAVASLPFKISSDKQMLDDKRMSLTHPKVKPLTNLDLTISQTALKRLASPAMINFAEPNKLYNPMPWQKKADETLIRGDKVGPTAAVVTNLTPLYLRLTLDQVTVSDAGPKYVIGVEKQAAPNPRDRVKKQAYCKLKDKNDTFTLEEVKGKPDDPTAVILMLNDSGERVTITREQPYRRVDGYMADLRYPPENKMWNNRRINSQPPLNFAGEEYNIVAINQSEVVLSAKSNGKKWTIKYFASAAP